MHKHTQGGYVRTILTIIIAVALLGYFSETIKGYIDTRVESESTKAPIMKGLDVTHYVWTVWLEAPANYLWNDIILGIVWPTIESKVGPMKESLLQPNVGVEGVGDGNQ